MLIICFTKCYSLKQIGHLVHCTMASTSSGSNHIRRVLLSCCRALSDISLNTFVASVMASDRPSAAVRSWRSLEGPGVAGGGTTLVDLLGSGCGVGETALTLTFGGALLLLTGDLARELLKPSTYLCIKFSYSLSTCLCYCTQCGCTIGLLQFWFKYVLQFSNICLAS